MQGQDQNLISRETPFMEAVQTAYIKYLLDNNKIGYRQKIAAVILNNKQQVLLVQLVQYDEYSWNIPGGGIENGETPEQTLARELVEELNIKNFKILNKISFENKYDWPEHVIVNGFKEGKKHKGQNQTQFVVKFTGENKDIHIQEKEIRKYKWVNYNELESHLHFPGQWENVKKILEEYEKENY